MKYSLFFPFFVLALIGCSPASRVSDGLESGLNAENFSSSVDGKTTGLFVLCNANGMEAAITNFGGRIVSLMVPDKQGTLRDVVLGHDSIQDYVNIDGNFGAIIGRYGNRINQGRFKIDDTEYQLPRNNFGHCLHGGDKGFHNRVWDVKQADDHSLSLSLRSPDGEDGFPGNIEANVIYTLTDSNSLSVVYEATTDKPTILNLTNHSYFNLSGDPSNDILHDQICIRASHITPIDSTFMTTGDFMPVENSLFDFRTPRTIEEGIASADQQIVNGKGYDHNFVIDNPGDLSAPVVTVSSPASGIVMEIFSDQPGIQFYSGNFLDGTVKGKKGIAYKRHSALCLEPQHFPDSPNKPDWPSTIVRPGETYRTQTIYRFSVNED